MWPNVDSYLFFFLAVISPFIVLRSNQREMSTIIKCTRKRSVAEGKTKMIRVTATLCPVL